MLHVLSVTTLAAFLTGLNARITVIGLPVIAAALGADLEQALWFTQAYLLGSSATQLVVGRLADLYGRVRLFTLGFAVFAVSMLLCGFASNPLLLIALRFVQGLGAALMISLSLTIIADNAPPDRLGTWLGVNQVAFRLGAFCGLTLGGLIIDSLGWRWLYWLFVPLGAAAVPWSMWRLREKYRPVGGARVDWVGFTLFTGSVTLILLSLTFAAYGMGFGSRGWELALLGLLLLAAFATWELRFESPALDLRLFRIWGFTGGVVAQLLFSIAFGATSVLAVIYMTAVKGMPPSEAGLLLVPFEAIFLVAGLLGGRLSDSVGYAPLTLAGCLTSSLSLYLLSTLGASSPTSLLVAYLALMGAGTGLFTSPNTSSILGSVPPERRGVASSIRTVAFNMGFTLSLNMAVLTMTRYIPYDVATRMIISGPNAGGTTPGGVEELAAAISSSYKVQSLVMLLAAAFSISRSARLESGGGARDRAHPSTMGLARERTGAL
uniref:MFS transporter n=1 Tax=Thermofilum pendens TaxID=2269 RepID=A0A7C3WS69_THEPE